MLSFSFPSIYLSRSQKKLRSFRKLSRFRSIIPEMEHSRAPNRRAPGPFESLQWSIVGGSTAPLQNAENSILFLLLDGAAPGPPPPRPQHARFWRDAVERFTAVITGLFSATALAAEGAALDQEPSSRAHLHPPYQRPGQQIVQSLFALCESDHDVADEQNHRREPLRKMSSRRPFE